MPHLSRFAPLSLAFIVGACSAPAGPSERDELAKGEAVADAAQAWRESTWGASRYVYAWAFVGVHAAFDGSVDPASSYNSFGQANRIWLDLSAGGEFRFRFPRVAGTSANPGNLQVIAHGDYPASCSIVSQTVVGTDVEGRIRCFAAALGLPYQARVAILFHRFEPATAETGWAYLTTQSGAGSESTPPGRNSSGGQSSVTRTGTGSYVAILPGQLNLNANVQVTARTPDRASRWCKVASWTRFSTQMRVTVRCFGPGGVFADSPFSLSYASNPVSPGTGAFAYADQPLASAYAPTNQRTEGTGPVTAAWTAPGVYALKFPGLSQFRPRPMVTTWGADSTFCEVSTWGGYNFGAQATLKCFNGRGQPSNTSFHVSVATPRERPFVIGDLSPTSVLAPP